MLRQEIVRNIPTNTSPDTVVVEQVVEKPVIVVIDRVVEKPVPVEQVVEKPVPVEEKTVDREPVAEKLDCEISISTQDYTFKVLKCFGDMTQKRITIQAAVTNVTDRNFDQERVEFRSAFTTDGVKLNSLDTDGLYQEYPSRVTRPRNFYITGVNSKIPGLSFVKLGIGGTTEPVCEVCRECVPGERDGGTEKCRICHEGSCGAFRIEGELAQRHGEYGQECQEDAGMGQYGCA